MQKRGQGVEYNWIFVLVAGVFILAFFIMFVFKYVELQEKKLSAQAGRAFDQALSTLEAGELYLDDDMFDLGLIVKIDMRCDEEEAYYLVNDYYDHKFGDIILFSDRNYQTRSFDAWINEWNEGFFITNFVYLADPNKVFYIVYDSSTAADVLENIDLPDVFNVKYVDYSRINMELDIENKKNPKIIFITQAAPSLNLDAQVMYIDRDNQRLVFIEDGNQYKDNYFSEALMFGAIYSGDYSSYSCMKNRAFNRLSKVVSLYALKASILNRLIIDSKCDYSQIQLSLEKLSQFAEEKDEDMVKQLNDFVVVQNKELGGRGCAVVF